MMNEHGENIRRRAYEIWEREGRPHGRKQDHWHQARRELDKGESGRGTRHDSREARGEPTDHIAQGHMQHDQLGLYEGRPPGLHGAIAELDKTLNALVEAIAADRAISR